MRMMCDFLLDCSLPVTIADFPPGKSSGIYAPLLIYPVLHFLFVVLLGHVNSMRLSFGTNFVASCFSV